MQKIKQREKGVNNTCQSSAWRKLKIKGLLQLTNSRTGSEVKRAYKHQSSFEHWVQSL